jgi:hypothetical protein
VEVILVPVLQTLFTGEQQNHPGLFRRTDATLLLAPKGRVEIAALIRAPWNHL